jgi:hypothetical protein
MYEPLHLSLMATAGSDPVSFTEQQRHPHSSPTMDDAKCCKLSAEETWQLHTWVWQQHFSKQVWQDTSATLDAVGAVWARWKYVQDCLMNISRHTVLVAGCGRGAGQQGCILSHAPSSSFAGAWQPGVSGGRKWLCDVGACCVRSGWHYTPPDQRSNAPSVQQKHLTECSEHAHVGRAPALNSAGNLTCTTATLILNAAQREAILAACIVLMFVPAAQ